MPAAHRALLPRPPLGPPVKADQAEAETGARTRVTLFAANFVISFIAVVVAVYAIYGDAPFVYMARETAFFLLRQLSVVRDLIGGIRSFNLF